MKNIFNYKYVVVAAALSSMAVVTSCREDFDYEEAYRTNPAFVYKESFEKAYGKIDPDQSWDFTTYNNSKNDTRATRAISYTKTVDTNKWYQVEDDMLTWLDTNLPEQKPNRSNGVGQTFSCYATGSDFTITPIYMGETYWNFTLYMELGEGNDKTTVELIQKGQYLRKKVSCSKCSGTGKVKEWYCAGCTEGPWSTEPDNATKRNHRHSSSQTKVTSRDINCPDCDGTGEKYTNLTVGSTSNSVNTIGAIGIQGNTIRISGIPEGTPIRFYLKMLSDYTTWLIPNIIKLHDWAITGNLNPSEEYMLSMTKNLPKLEHLPSEAAGVDNSDHEIMIIGCEASRGDTDYNDLVLLVEGYPFIPRKIEVTEEGESREITSVVSKRYMVEDLGCTTESDIDFNDLVIDFTEEQYKVIKYEIKENGSITKEETGETGVDRTAKVLALGGTKNIAVYLSKNDADNAAPAPGDVCIFRKVGNATYDNMVEINSNYSKDKNGNVVFSIADGLDASIMYNTKQAQTEKGDGCWNTTDVIAEIDLSKITDATHQWDPSKNNIYVVVENSNSGSTSPFEVTDGTTIKFPKKGEVPAMIAVDTNKPWNWEKCTVFDPKDPANGYILHLEDGGVE